MNPSYPRQIVNIAHELGHLFLMHLFSNNEAVDRLVIPKSSNIQSDFTNGNRAYIWVEFVTCDRDPIYHFNKFKNISDFGGIFGELVSVGRFYPWGSRADIEIFLSANQESKSKLVEELYYWMYVDDDSLSFREVSKELNLHIRRTRFLTDKVMQYRLPRVYDLCTRFTKHLNKTEFMSIVDEMRFNNRKQIYTRKELSVIAERITNE